MVVGKKKEKKRLSSLHTTTNYTIKSIAIQNIPYIAILLFSIFKIPLKHRWLLNIDLEVK